MPWKHTGNEGVAPHACLGTGWSWVSASRLRDRRLGGLHSWLDPVTKIEISCLPGIEPQFPGRKPVACGICLLSCPAPELMNK
jgi:hypothetical protein